MREAKGDNRDRMYTDEQKMTYEKVKIHQLINFDVEPANTVKVSIVIPVYNVEQYLVECLNSAVNQTLHDIEIICVNDGSKDDSLEILLDFAKRDSRVKIVDKENAGYGHTMNLGMDMARGEYIGIIESDDYVDLQMYEDLYRLAKEKRLDWIKADFNRFIVEKNRVINTYNDVAKKKEYYNRVISPAEEPFSFRFIMNTWSGIYNRQFLVLNNIRHQETPGASFQDNGFWFQTMIYAKRIYVVDSPYYMNRRDNPNSSVYDKGKADCIIEEYNYIYDILCRDKGKLQFFAPQYYLKKYHNYLFHYNRIANKDRAVFLEKISKEFRSTIEQEEVEQEIFFSQEWDEFEWIAYDPKDYYAQHNDDSIDVSIIIPVYNAAPYLKKCLDSVLGQTHRNIEVICIDDGSEDESLEILNNYAKKDNRMIVLTQMNGGGGTARNKGLDIAKGEYLLFLDADDFFEEELAEIVYNTCKKRSADVCIYRVKTYDNRTGKVFSDKGSFIKENIPGKDVFAPKDMPEKLFITFQTWPWNKMFRRHFIEKEKIRFQEIKRTNDMFFTYSALMKADRITTVDKELVYYRIGNPNSCQSTNEVAPLDFSKALMKLHDEMETSEKYVVYKESWLNLLVKSCIYNLNKQNEPSVYRYVYDFLHDEFLPPMELTEIRLTDGCLINADDYKECLKIVNQTYDAYMLDKLVWYRNETARLQKRVNFMKGTVSEAFTKEIMVSKDESMKEIIRLKDENTRLQLELVATRTSMSCRIGLALTFLPRKIVKMFRNLLVRNQTIKSLSILL